MPHGILDESARSYTHYWFHTFVSTVWWISLLDAKSILLPLPEQDFHCNMYMLSQNPDSTIHFDIMYTLVMASSEGGGGGGGGRGSQNPSTSLPSLTPPPQNNINDMQLRIEGERSRICDFLLDQLLIQNCIIMVCTPELPPPKTTFLSLYNHLHNACLQVPVCLHLKHSSSSLACILISDPCCTGLFLDPT